MKLAVLKVESLKTAPWRFQFPTLLEASFRGNLTADELSLLEGYERLAATLANLLEPLDRLAAISGGAEDVNTSIQNLLESQDAPTMALPPVLTTLESQVERLGNLASNPTQTEVDSIVTGIADAAGTIEISRESELRELVKELALRLRSEVKEGEYEVKCQVKKSAGEPWNVLIARTPERLMIIQVLVAREDGVRSLCLPPEVLGSRAKLAQLEPLI